MSKLQKYAQVCCAWCGSLVRGKGWFCSFKCDAFEFNARSEASRALYEAGRPVKRA